MNSELPKQSLGRWNRATFWLALGIIVAAYVAIALFREQHTAVSEVVLVIACVPRLHDIGKSGWLVLGPIALEVAAFILVFSALPADLTRVVLGVVILIIIGLIVWLGCVPGDRSANKFGEPPPPGLQLGRSRKP